MKPLAYVTLTFAAAALACSPIAKEAVPPAPTQASPANVGTVVPEAATATLTSVAQPATEPPEEAILIRTPGNGSRLVGEVHVEGAADSTFEQTLVVAVVLLGDPETILAQQPVMIEAELGQRGPFVADVVFDYDGGSESPGQIRVFAVSPRDGGLTHLASSHVTLASSGESEVRAMEPHAEQIFIAVPLPGQRVAGGTARVEGVALASFEQTLVAEVYDINGAVIGWAPITVDSDEMGVPGPFAVDVPYTVGAAGAGRIAVFDPSPAFGQTLHLASVEVQIEP
jgi:hypothetical protein